MRTKVYLNVFATSFKQKSKTLLSVFLRAVSFVLIVFVFIQLWNYVFDSGISSVEGFSKENVVWYFIVGEVIVFCANSRTSVKEMSHAVQSGDITYKLNKPYNYFVYTNVNYISEYTLNFLFIIPTAALIGAVFVGFDAINIYSVVFGLISVYLACILICLTSIVIGLAAFWVEDAVPFYWIYQKFILIIGVFFPPQFFPSVIERIIIYSPIYASVSGPSMLFAKFSWEMAASVFISQIAYVAVFALLGFFMFARGKKKVNVNGG